MKSIRTEDAPAPVKGAPYSQAIECPAKRLLFVSGQVPVDPASGDVVPGGIAEQTAQVMKNLLAIVAAAGGSATDIAKTTIYLTDLADFGTVNGIYGDALGGHTPARATVQVAALPVGVSVEIDAIAVLGG